MVRFLGVLVYFIGAIQAKDYGVQGTTYPVTEDSLLEHIRHQLSHMSPETLNLKQLEIQARVKQTVLNPTLVSRVQKATTYRAYTLDPTIRLEKDILDDEGNVIGAKGSTYNPLVGLTLKESLLLFDGRDPQQVAWALAQGDSTKWILISGRPLDLMKQLDRPVYFDQEGVIIRRFKIRAVPALVRQNGKVLEIEEGIKEGDGHAY